MNKLEDQYLRIDEFLGTNNEKIIRITHLPTGTYVKGNDENTLKNELFNLLTKGVHNNEPML